MRVNSTLSHLTDESKNVNKWNTSFQEEKLSTVCNFLHTDREIDRDTLASLNMSPHKRRSKSSRHGDEQYCNEINSTNSFLSDLSATQFDDDNFEISSLRPFKVHCPSTTLSNTSYVETKQRRRSARRSMDLRSKSESIKTFEIVTFRIEIIYDFSII